MGPEMGTQSSPLAEELKRSGAHMAEREGWLVAADFGSLGAEIAVSRRAAGLTDVSSLGKLELRGAASALAELRPTGAPPAAGEAVESAGSWWCALTGELLLVLSAPAIAARVRDELTERAAEAGAELADVTAERVAICLTGPAAGDVLTAAGATATPVGGLRVDSVGGVPTVVLHQREQVWLLVAAASDAGAVWHSVSDAGAPFGLANVGADALKHLDAVPSR
jgi:glycine cleavage system aminomethyltransferase T